ncbi:MAG: carbohydrate ABC transporter permease [Acutalibacteraceae bacterium]|nr:carbohydrate ABC transporter permease [Acutalibacteraceae bacterium]
MDNTLSRRQKIGRGALTAIFSVISAVWFLPVIVVLYNSFKNNDAIKTSLFSLPNAESFVGFENYVEGIMHGNYPFYESILYSLIITILSVALILLCTSMAAWYISRVDSFFCKVVYYLCIFSMVVPFQMVMFTLSKTADKLQLDTPWTIPIVYLGFGAGLAVFMFTGFIKSIPIDIEEAASIDGCTPLQTFFLVVAPIMKSTYISVCILEVMWVWNDYLLPYLVLDKTKFRTIPIQIQYLQGSYGQVDYGATMALIVLCLLPIVIVYLTCQKHIIKGVLSGAVKG